MTKLKLKLGKSWLSIDRTGAMVWINPLNRNYYLWTNGNISLARSK